MDEFCDAYSDTECEAELDLLFPHGFSGSDVRSEIAFEKLVRIVENDANESDRNIRELVGRCLWDIFADQHEVVGNHGRLVGIGSGRGAGEFLADYLNRRTGRREFDYMSFYMGSSAPWSEREDDLTSVYQMIFGRLKRRGLDWAYRFPRIYLVDFRPLRDALDREGKADWAGYSPSEAIAKEAEEQRRDREIAEINEQLEDGRNESIEHASRKPPPPTVQAYRNVYGNWPNGWPPTPGA